MINRPLIKSSFPVKTEQEMKTLGAKLASYLKAPQVIALYGTLGAGKTTFVRGFIQALTEEEVPSPTFTLLQTYPTDQGDIYHYDFYRLKSPEEALELNIDEAFSSGISFLEWPEKIGKYLPKKYIKITFEVLGTERLVTIEGVQ